MRKSINQPFGWEPNEIIFNPEISMKAKGLWLYMNAKPDGWKFAAKRIAEECSDGIDSIRSGLKELAQAGLLEARRQGDGSFLYILSDGRGKQDEEEDEDDVDEEPKVCKADVDSVSRQRPARNNYETCEEYEKALYAWNRIALEKL